MIGFEAAAEPYQVVLDICQNADFESTKDGMIEAGWRDVSSPATYQAAVMEIRYQQIRTKLSRASYPDRWTDMTVSQIIPSRSATDLKSLSAFQEEATRLDRYPSNIVPQAVLELGDGQATLVIHGTGQQLQCWLSGFQNENPTLVGDILTTERKRSAGYGPVGVRLKDRELYITLLSDHARQIDDLFPVHYDFTFALLASN